MEKSGKRRKNADKRRKRLEKAKKTEKGVNFHHDFFDQVVFAQKFLPSQALSSGKIKYNRNISELKAQEKATFVR